MRITSISLFIKDQNSAQQENSAIGHTPNDSSFTYPHADSQQRKHYTEGVVRGEIIRYLRDSSNTKEYEKIKQLFELRLIRCRYLSILGGRKLVDVVGNIMEEIMYPDVAKSYTWTRKNAHGSAKKICNIKNVVRLVNGRSIFYSNRLEQFAANLLTIVRQNKNTASYCTYMS